MIRFAVLCFIRMFRSSLFTSEMVACGKQHVVVVLLLMFLIMELPTIRVLGSAALWAICCCLLDLERLLVAMLAAGWYNPCSITFGDSSPTFISASNLFSRCTGGGRIPVFASLVTAISGIEDATAAIWDTCDNLMSWVPLGLAPCLCHRLVCRSVSACSSTLEINCWDSLDSQDSPAVCWGGPWWRSVMCSTCFGSNFVSRTAILCRSLWQFMQQVDSIRGIFSLFCLNVDSCVFPSLECKLLAVGGRVFFEHWADLLKLKIGEK